MLGGLGAGVYPDVAAALQLLRRESTRVEPAAEQVGVYDAIYQRVYRALYPALRPFHQTLQQIKESV
jgi:sugar (pentulose or hexulose) kinase